MPDSPYLTLQNLKYQNQSYWDMMDLSQGVDPVVSLLMEKLPSGSIFEYGAGRGRNTIPLTQAGYTVHAQDIAELPLLDLKKRADELRLDIQLTQSEASQHVLTQNYDALICLRVLHFLERQDALQVISQMQSHTNTGGMNALVVFINESPHGSTEYVTDPFFSFGRRDIKTLC